MLAFYTVTIYLQNYEAFSVMENNGNATSKTRSVLSWTFNLKAKEHMSNGLLWWKKDAGHIDYTIGLSNMSKGFSKKVTFILRPEGWVKFSQVEKVGNSYKIEQ